MTTAAEVTTRDRTIVHIIGLLAIILANISIIYIMPITTTITMSVITFIIIALLAFIVNLFFIGTLSQLFLIGYNPWYSGLSEEEEEERIKKDDIVAISYISINTILILIQSIYWLK